MLINPEAVDGHRYAIGLVDSFSSYQKVYFLKRDDALEKFVLADIGNPGTLVCDGAGEFNSNEIKQLYKARLKTRVFSTLYT